MHDSFNFPLVLGRNRCWPESKRTGRWCCLLCLTGWSSTHLKWLRTTQTHTPLTGSCGACTSPSGQSGINCRMRPFLGSEWIIYTPCKFQWRALYLHTQEVVTLHNSMTRTQPWLSQWHAVIVILLNGYCDTLGWREWNGVRQACKTQLVNFILLKLRFSATFFFFFASTQTYTHMVASACPLSRSSRLCPL